MNNGGEVADQMVRESLQFAEVAVKLMALGFKNSIALALALAKENPKVRGRTNLDRLLREGKELKVIPIQAKDLKQFTEQAKRYGILFASIKDRADHGEKLDILFKAEDVAKLNRIYERLGYTVPKPQQDQRKKDPTRRPSEHASQARGNNAERIPGVLPDARPSVRASIQRLRQVAQRMSEAQKAAIEQEAR